MIQMIQMIQSGLVLGLVLVVACLICYILKLYNNNLKAENAHLKSAVAAQRFIESSQHKLESVCGEVLVAAIKALILGRPEFCFGPVRGRIGVYAVYYLHTNRPLFYFELKGECCVVQVVTRTAGVAHRTYHYSQFGELLSVVQCTVCFPELVEV